MRKVALTVEHTCKKKEQKKCHPARMAQKTKDKKESTKSRMQACQCGTTLTMSLVTSCTLASLLLSSAKLLSFNNKKKKKKTLKKPTKRSDKVFFFFVSIVHTSARFQKKNQSQELWQVSEKGCVCVRVLHMKHSENKIPDEWHLKHDKRYFHA